ncbi:MAG: hypothetical protein E7652_01350 [Ruminococcaceae bacterium]|nr:hypothetical protein [Oscillospiraceae bacterium]
MRNPFRNVELKINSHWKAKLATLGYFIAVFIYLELALHFVIFKSVDARIIYPILFAAVSGTILFFISSLFKQTVNRILSIVILSAVVIYFEVQMVYHFVFQGFMPVSQIALGADAVTNYTAQIFHAIGINIVSFLIVLLPLPLTIFLFAKKIIKSYRVKLLQLPLVLVIGGIFLSAVMIILHANNTSPNSAYAVLVDNNTQSKKSVKNLGLAVTTVQEFRGLFMSENYKLVFFETDLNNLNNDGQPRNEGDINFIALSEMTEDEQVRYIDLYLNGVSPTSKNKYTGIAKDYNVISICAEAFSPLLIDKELTPTLYKLSNNGLVFNNFYNSFPNTTTNGEYAFCMGLFPEMSRTKVSSSFSASIGHYLPYCLGNVFNDMGYEAYAFHDYFGNFYSRNITHKNMGYDFYAIGNGLDMDAGIPSSDLEMMEVSVPYYIDSEEPFHAYYMTYSGHYQYNWDNEMSAKNREDVEHLDYSEEVKAYIACNLELEYALSYLMDRLEEAGIADKTMIVLTGDHYPYGLTIEQYNELAGHKVDESFEKYKNSFICYIPGIEKVEVDEYCCSVDILPTVLNLIGAEFDSRLLVGKDVMSDAPHLAVISNQSFITSDFMYDAENGVAKAHDGSKVPQETVDSYCNYVRNMFTLSSAILDTNYYGHVFNVKSEDVDDYGVTYTDIASVYVESAVGFMEENGWMTADSDTEFGANRNEGYINVIDIMYQMAGSPEVVNETEYSDSIIWALENNIIKNIDSTKLTVTNGDLAYSIYNFAKMSGCNTEVVIDDEEYARLSEYLPGLTREELVPIKYCVDNQILYTNVNLDKYYKDYYECATRGYIAVFLQRMYYICNPANTAETDVQETEPETIAETGF